MFTKIPNIPAKNLLLSGLLFALAFSTVTTAALAQPTTGVDLSQPNVTTSGSQRPLQGVQFLNLAVKIIEWAIIVLLIANIGVYGFGIYRWAKSKGDKEKLLDAKKTFAVATIAMIILLIAYAIMAFMVEEFVASLN